MCRLTGPTALFLAALCALATPLYAQQTTPAERPFAPLFLPGVHYGAPLRTAAGLAVFLPTKEEPGFRRSGFIVEGSAGQGGVRASVGPAGILEYLMLDGRAVFCRTWQSPRNASPDATYAGAEAGMTIAYVRVSAGVLRRLSGPSGKDATIFSWNIGVHFPLSR